MFYIDQNLFTFCEIKIYFKYVNQTKNHGLYDRGRAGRLCNFDT